MNNEIINEIVEKILVKNLMIYENKTLNYEECFFIIKMMDKVIFEYYDELNDEFKNKLFEEDDEEIDWGCGSLWTEEFDDDFLKLLVKELLINRKIFNIFEIEDNEIPFKTDNDDDDDDDDDDYDYDDFDEYYDIGFFDNKKNGNIYNEIYNIYRHNFKMIFVRFIRQERESFLLK